MGKKRSKKKVHSLEEKMDNVVEEKESEISEEEIPIQETIEKKENETITDNNDQTRGLDDSEEKGLLDQSTTIATISPEKKKVKEKIMIICIVVFLFLFFLFGGIVCINKMNTKVYKNVFIFNDEISGYTIEELKEYLERKNEVILENKIAIFQDTENIYTVSEEDINLKIDVDETIHSVMGFGRTNHILIDNFQIIKALFQKKIIEVSYTYDHEKVEEILKNVDLSLKDRVVDSKYSIDEENKNIVITIGKSGNGFDFSVEERKLIELLKQEYNADSLDRKIYLDMIKKTPEEMNVDEIYENVKREAVDAYIDKSSTPMKVVKEKIGYDFKKEELREVLEKEENKEEGKQIEFPLEIIEPKVKLENLEGELYQDKLAGYTTYFNAGQYARANNLEIALRYLNGKVIMPGEVFSYNDAIGDTTAAKGYLPAATFKGGTTVDEMGGGICQTTSTLYNVVLMANLEIVERHAHGLPVGYVQPSRDATVYSPYLDFKFKNIRSNPIKIVTSYSSAGNLNISIYGLKEEKEYQVDIISQYLATVPFTTKYIYDDNMSEGQQQVISAGVNGYTSQSFISKKLDGVQVSYDFLSKDTYNPQQQVVKVGTKKNTTQEPPAE